MNIFETNLVGCDVKFPVRSLEDRKNGLKEETGRVVGATREKGEIVLYIAVHGSGEIIKKCAIYVQLFGGIFE